MKVYTTLCDYCGKETSHIKYVSLKAKYWISNVLQTILLSPADMPRLEGDVCYDCFESYKKWVKSRKYLKSL